MGVRGRDGADLSRHLAAGRRVADDPAYDLGQGAGFMSMRPRPLGAAFGGMWHYITHELPELVFGNFALDREAQGITGHSMAATAR